ncbi:hypothetical protein [Winogradskyella immobilis]|uniref:Uncharacterized protein n=1 Tax=Winogradskyella immobilis TaxID=2816852 RepID=A0ABS8EL27_9FLAO|nr:hypothetical protein [Winogradskyella immobilis]MCC1483722.1 hypothetical protein [Winogradskyella immobilis]MCG0015816.1 hypothetical protein [Winogradskyella immobilis]
MRNLLILFCISFLITACDDGDIITVSLDFDQELERCENDTQSYLFFDTRVDPSESLSLIIPRNDANELLFSEPTPIDQPVTMDINGNTVRFNYRTYNRDIIGDELCNIIPSSDLIINEDFESPAGTVEITSTIFDDDNDGVPTAFEGADPNGDGDFSDSLDTDGDGLFDYIDSDDDNDNVPTINEIDNSDGDDDPNTNPMDTDGNGTPDYLDDDDDGDMVLTRFEDENTNDNPRDDTANNAEGVLVPHYLNDQETGEFTNVNTITTTYTRIVFTNFIVRDVDIEILRTDIINLGTLESTITLPEEDDN